MTFAQRKLIESLIAERAATVRLSFNTARQQASRDNAEDCVFKGLDIGQAAAEKHFGELEFAVMELFCLQPSCNRCGESYAPGEKCPACKPAPREAKAACERIF